MNKGLLVWISALGIVGAVSIYGVIDLHSELRKIWDRWDRVKQHVQYLPLEKKKELVYKLADWSEVITTRPVQDSRSRNTYNVATSRMVSDGVLSIEEKALMYHKMGYGQIDLTRINEYREPTVGQYTSYLQKECGRLNLDTLELLLEKHARYPVMKRNK